jgi:hypothetical protein
MSITAIIDAGGGITVEMGAAQGLAGVPGSPGGAGAVYTAAEPVSGHTVLAVDASGQVFPASADTLSHALRIAGVSLNAAALGDDATIVAAGLVQHDGWAWTPDEPVYLGLGGALVQSLPVEALFSRVIGTAAGATRLLVGLQPPIVLA